MSLFKNRIPKNSVSFSDETYELQFPRKVLAVQEQEESESEVNAEFLAQQEELHRGMQQLRREQQMLAEEKERFEQERQQFQVQVNEQMQQLEAARIQLQQEGQETAYEWAELLWEQSLQLAEKIVNQAIDIRKLDLLPILKGIVQTIPTSFEKLTITVHPETYERIKIEKENSKEYWLLELVEWKYDFSMQFGEFVIEEEKEFFEFKFAPIFENLRQKWEEQKRFEEQHV